MKIHDVEQNTDAWLVLRAGRPTASNFKLLVTSKGAISKSLEGYALTLAGEKYAGKPLDSFEGNQWTERGHELEDKARELYEMVHDVTVEKVGFVTNGEAGCSPDSLVGEDGLWEAKCLKAENHIKALMRYEATGLAPPDYFQQAQGQMMICERQWNDLTFYHPELPLLVIRIPRDEKFISELRSAVADVCTERERVLCILKGIK
tara:strand:+ start:113 stop:727 length:615 start_codon:yes stop_codon:yes gene_type:complete